MTATRSATPRSWYLAAVCTAALALHLHTEFTVWVADGSAPSAFALGVLAWSLLPYAACLVAARATAHVGPALSAATLILLLDIATCVCARSSRDGQTALVFLFMPLWNLVIVAPVTLMIGEFAVRRKLRASSAR